MSAPIPISSSADRTGRGRRVGIAVLLWVFGISTTLFLFSLWGRAVVSDTSLLSRAASRMADADMVTSRVEAWFDAELDDAGLDAAGPIGTIVAALPEVRSATAALVGEMVRVAAEPSGEETSVDVAEFYRPAVPAVTASLAGAGIPVTEEQVASVVNELDPLVIRSGEAPPVVGPDSAGAGFLTVATLLALLAMVLSGTGAVMLSKNRWIMTRSLFNRLAVSGVTYAVFFQLTSWVLDPGGGRASPRGALAQIMSSKLWIPLLLTAIAGSAGWAIRHRHVRNTVTEPERLPDRS